MIGQLARFAGVGGLATLTHVGAALLAQHLLPLTAQAANLIGFFAAVGVSYVGHARLTFGRKMQDGGQFARFLIASLVSLGTSSLVVWVATERLGLGFAGAMLAVGLLVPGAAYLAMRFWVFAQGAPH